MLEKEMATHTPVLLPGKLHELRSLVGHNPWGCSQTRLSDFTFFFFYNIVLVLLYRKVNQL